MVLSAFSIAGFLCCLATVAGADCGYNQADIVFLLDSSSSVGASGFSKLKDFVATFARVFDIGSQNVQMGVTTFANSPHNEFNLNTYHDKMTLINKIHNISYIGLGSRTDLALAYVEANGFTKAAGDRDHAANVLIVITDGASDLPALTNAEARKLHRVNVEVIAIGTGLYEDLSELTRIASDPRHMFWVPNFDVLHSLQAELKKTVCNTTCADTHPDPLYCKQFGICRSVEDSEKNCKKTCGGCGSGWV